MRLVSKSFIIISLAAAVATPVVADDPMKALEVCAKIPKDKKRLACYDAVLKVDTTAAEKASFGLNRVSENNNPLTRPVAPEKTNKTEMAEKSTAAAEMTETKPKDKDVTLDKEGNVKGVSRQVSNAKKDRNGRLVFTMSDGSVWRQTDDNRRAIKRGAFDVTISKTGIGSYILKPHKGSWSIRVKRIK